MHRLLIATVLLLPASAAAQLVYKCPGRDGVPVYQSDPCAGAAAEKTWDARAPQVSPQDQARIDRQRAETERATAERRRPRAGVVRGSSSVRVPSRAQSRQTRCEAAKRERDAYFRRRGLARTYDELSHWQTRVYEQCK